MSAVIGALRAELSASIAQFQSDMGKAADSLSGFSKTARGVAKELDDVGKKMSLAITAPLTLLAKAGYDQAKQASQAIGQVEAALVSTGGASGKTAEELEKSAKQLEDISTFDKNDILRNVTANLLTFGNVQGDVFERGQKLIVNMAARLGTDLEGATIKWGRALNDPIQGVTALTRVGVQFTQAQKDQIKALVLSGQGIAAQNILLDVAERKFNGAAEALRKASPDAALQQSWREFKETLGNILIQILPPITDFLKKMLDSFSTLSPGVQKFLIIAGGVLAVMGPLLIVFGSLIQTSSVLIPLIYGLATATGALWTASLGLFAVIGFIVAGLFLLQPQLSKTTKAVNDQADAHKTLTDALDKAKDSGGKLNAVEAAMIRQKLMLAAATNKAALAQDEQNLATAQAANTKANQSYPGSSFLGAYARAASGEQLTRAQTAVAKVKAAIAQNQADLKILQTAATPPPAAKPPVFNTGNDKTAINAAKELQNSITQTSNALSHGLDEVDLPKATVQANAFNRQIDDFVKKAADAGVNVKLWGGQIATLRSRISELEKAGLAKEAIEFQGQVDKDQIAVDKFVKGGLPALEQKLQDVNASYADLTDTLTGQIAHYSKLAETQDDAAKTMERLKAILAGLPAAHDAATKAARAQAAAEEDLAHLASQSQQLQTSNDIRDFNVASGRTSGPVSSAQADLQKANDDLAAQQIETATTLRKMEEDRATLVEQNVNHENDQKIADADAQIKLQTTLNDLVTKTTGEQIDAANRINEAYKQFGDDVSSSLLTMVTDFKGGLKGLLNSLQTLVLNAFVKPLTDQLGTQLSAILKQLFASLTSGAGGGGADYSAFFKNIGTFFDGMFADGGRINAGHWGIAGENGPEPIYGGSTGVSVVSNKDATMGRNVTQIFNITSPDATGFRRGQRQIARTAKQGLG